MRPRLNFGDHLTGVLVDGIEGTPFVGATIYFTKDGGLTVEIPYVEDDAGGQYTTIREWITSRHTPERMLFRAGDLVLELHGVSLASSRSRYASSLSSHVKLRADQALLATRNQSLSEPLAFERSRSTLDGLSTWGGLTSVDKTITQGSGGKPHTADLHLECPPPLEWTHGEAHMRIVGNWAFESQIDDLGRKLVIRDQVLLECEFATPKPFEDHYTQLYKVANLLRLAHGRSLAFRQHRVHSPTQYPEWAELLATISLDQRKLAEVSEKDLTRPLFALDQIGVAGMQAWGDRYDQWHRFILPSASVMQRSELLVEDIIVSTSMSIEAAGLLLGKTEGESDTYHRGKATTATHFFRCLSAATIDTSAWRASRVGVARALAGAYNTTKHPDRGGFVSIEIGSIAASINSLVVRLLAARLIDPTMSIVDKRHLADTVAMISTWLEQSGLAIKDDGKWA